VYLNLSGDLALLHPDSKAGSYLVSLLLGKLFVFQMMLLLMSQLKDALNLLQLTLSPQFSKVALII
jgi:hypothetical protein